MLDESRTDFAVMEITPTGLAKSTLDATTALRALLQRSNIHNYAIQGRGPENRVHVETDLVFADGRRIRSTASLVRPSTGSGDPRIWFRGLRDLVRPWQKLAVCSRNGYLQLLNISETRLDVTTVDVQHDDSESIDYWDALGMLWQRATGGPDVAARPVDRPSWWPTVQRPAGVDEAISWFKESLERDGTPRFLFLVGGPGAGKSHASREVVANLQDLNPKDERLAERTYRYSCGTRELVLVNDATISSDEHTTHPLTQEVQAAAVQGNHLMACVNRGVLVEETSARGDSKLGPEIGRVVLEWVHDPVTYETNLFDADEQEGLVIIAGQPGSYLRTGRLYSDASELAEITVVNVDACSLLEPTPRTSRFSSPSVPEELMGSTYQVTPSHLRGNLAPHDTAAGSLLADVVEKLEQLTQARSEGFVDPFTANLHSLRAPKIQMALLSTLRASEVLAGQRLTFRDLWGVVARAIVGDAPSKAPSSELLHWLRALQPTTTEPIARFGELRALAAFRFSQAIFAVGSDDPNQSHHGVSNLSIRMLQSVDPVRDAIPGWLARPEDGHGWATPIVEAFSGTLSSESPLEALKTIIPADDPFHLSENEFERQLDDGFVKALGQLRDRQREEVIGWYGRYLTRLYAASNGVSAFRRETDIWALAHYMSPDVPSDLEGNLQTLLRPTGSSGSDSNSLIPIFDSRTTPIIGEVTQPKLALNSTSFQVESSVIGDELFFSAIESGVRTAPILLDFALVRQAMSCSAGRTGVTDVSDDTSPRLERFRSARLVPDQLGVTPSYVVLDGSKRDKIQVKAHE